MAIKAVKLDLDECVETEVVEMTLRDCVAEIDKIIWHFEAHKALAAERRRRADWRKCELAAERFRAERNHVDAVALPRSAPDQMQ
jgi:hypothetical protein